MIIYMKNHTKNVAEKEAPKRARRARRRTRKAGEYSKLAKDLLRSKTDVKIFLEQPSACKKTI